jgi:hypothetical protein
MRLGAIPAAFSRAAIPRSEWFAHKAICIAKQYPDTYLNLRQRGIPVSGLKTGSFRQINLYLMDSLGLPAEVFADPDLNWHGQQCGLGGLIAAAGIWLPDRLQAVITILESHVSQQISRPRYLTGHIASRFGRWPRILLNAILDWSASRGIEAVYCPMSSTVLRGISEDVEPGTYSRIYNDCSQWLRCSQVSFRGSDYWRIAIRENEGRIVPLSSEPASNLPEAAGVCLFHDVEENLGAEGDGAPGIAADACHAHFLESTAMERRLLVPLTLSIPAILYKKKVDSISAKAITCTAFHSYNHVIPESGQLSRSRTVDPRVKGYRPPQSRITAEVTDFTLSYFNFEWLLSSGPSLRSKVVHLSQGIVRIPVDMDDYPMAIGLKSYAQWRDAIFRLIDTQPLVVIGTHDCYANAWIGDYERFLTDLQKRSRFVTCTDIANAVFLASGENEHC